MRDEDDDDDEAIKKEERVSSEDDDAAWGGGASRGPMRVGRVRASLALCAQGRGERAQADERKEGGPDRAHYTAKGIHHHHHHLCCFLPPLPPSFSSFLTSSLLLLPLPLPAPTNPDPLLLLLPENHSHPVSRPPSCLPCSIQSPARNHRGNSN